VARDWRGSWCSSFGNIFMASRQVSIQCCADHLIPALSIIFFRKAKRKARDNRKQPAPKYGGKSFSWKCGTLRKLPKGK
jgi:hypothetical protein